MQFAAPRAASLWTPTVDGESLAIEFFLPKGVASGSLRVAVPALSHLEIEPKRIGEIREAGCPNHIDAACRTDLVSRPARRGVANYVFTTRYGRDEHLHRVAPERLRSGDADSLLPDGQALRGHAVRSVEHGVPLVLQTRGVRRDDGAQRAHDGRRDAACFGWRRFLTDTRISPCSG